MHINYSSVLSATKCVMSSTGFADLLSVSTLRSLDLSDCVHVSGTEIVKGLKGSSAARAQLESLNLKSCTYIRVSQCVCTACLC